MSKNLVAKKTVVIDNISLSFFTKTILENVSLQFPCASKIAIVGNNGAGKSTLLKIIAGQIKPDQGSVFLPSGLSVVFLEQNNFTEGLSGGQGFNAALTKCITQGPDLLLLDEPSNHLDEKNRNSLIGFVNRATFGIIVASHDQDLIRSCHFDQIWELASGKVSVFNCSWEEFLEQKRVTKAQIEQQVEELSKEKRKLKKAFEFERKKAGQSARINAEENDKKLLGAMKASGEATLSRKLGNVNKKLDQNRVERSAVHKQKEFSPKFNLVSKSVTSGTILQVSNGQVCYKTHRESVVLESVNFLLGGDEKLLLTGTNGSGKTTLLKAILGSSDVEKSGIWVLSKGLEIAFLDQHYKLLGEGNTVFDEIKLSRPDWTVLEVQEHLNHFLFSGPKALENIFKNLSGGERARLVLAKIGAKTPDLLILDEPSNNLDIQTKEYLARVIGSFPGAIIMTCHEKSFVEQTAIAWSILKL